MADAFWLGKLGKNALAAPAISWPIVFLLISLGIGMAIAGTTLVAQYTGAGDKEGVTKSAGQTFAFMFLIAIILGIVGFVFTPQILTLMGAKSVLLTNATIYLRIIFAGLPFMFGYHVFTALLRGWGDTVTPMKLTFYAVIANIILDPLFIFGIGPLPKWGVAGAAVATVISRASLAFIGMFLLFSGRVGIKLKARDLKLNLPMIKKIVSIGFPASIGQSGMALGLVILMTVIASFGVAAVGAFGVGNRVVSLALMPAMGLGFATTTMVGQNIGADKKKRAEHITWIGAMLSALILLAGAFLAFYFRGELFRLFINDPDVIAQGSQFFKIVSFSLPFLGILQVMIGAFQGSGHTIPAMFFTLFRLWAIRIPLAYVLGYGMKLGADGVWWSMLISNILTACVSALWFTRGTWKEAVISKKRVVEVPVSVVPEITGVSDPKE